MLTNLIFLNYQTSQSGNMNKYIDQNQIYNV